MIGLNIDSITSNVMLVFFKSTFCSKCMVSINHLTKFVPKDNLLIIDIAESHPLIYQLRPQRVPYLVLIHQQKIISVKSGILSLFEARMYGNTIKQLKNLSLLK